MDLKKPLTLLGLLLLVLFFCLPVMANETITSMGDLAPLDNTVQDDVRSDQASYSNPRILIYYNSPGENNIGQLGLQKDDFTAGKTLTNELDLLEVSQQADSQAIIDQLDDHPQVKAVDYDVKAQALNLPNDRYVDRQYGYSQMGLDKCWQKTNENTVKVAVLDTGLNTQSEDLAGRTGVGYDFVHDRTYVSDDNGHGTAVAHILCACTNNTIGMAGTSGTFNVVAIPYKVLDSKGYGKLSVIAPAMIAAANDPTIQVINLSLGFESENSVLDTVVQGCYDKNKVVVASSGNDGGSVLYPAKYNQVISVGSVDQNEKLCTSEQWGAHNGSNHGQGLDFVAPGNEIVTSDGDSYFFGSGTSYSAPEVSAAVAVLLSEDPSLSNEQVKAALRTTAKDLGNNGYDTSYGYGLIQIDKALQKVRNEKSQHQQSGDDPSTPITPVYRDVRLALSAHCENVGWQSPVSNLDICGTVGQNQKLEAFILSDDNQNINIISQVHVENIGTIDPVSEGLVVGTTGHNFGIESVMFEISGVDASEYTLYYRTHVENYGWTAWTSNGNWSGTSGLNLQLEAMQLAIVKAGDPPPSIASDVNWTYR